MKTGKLLLLGMTALSAVSSCQKYPGATEGGADRILIGNVITMDKDSTLAQAVAFKDGNVHFHCIGDGATALAVKGIIRGQNAAGVKDGRNTIAHLQLVNPEDIRRMADNSIIAVSAPQWDLLDHDEYSLIEGYIGDRVNTMFPAKPFLDAGALLNFHSDYPITVPLRFRQLRSTSLGSGDRRIISVRWRLARWPMKTKP